MVHTYIYAHYTRISNTKFIEKKIFRKIDIVNNKVRWDIVYTCVNHRRTEHKIWQVINEKDCRKWPVFCIDDNLEQIQTPQRWDTALY